MIQKFFLSCLAPPLLILETYLLIHMSDKAHPILVWKPQDTKLLKEVAETVPLEQSGKPLKALLDTPDVTSKLIQGE